MIQELYMTSYQVIEGIILLLEEYIDRPILIQYIEINGKRWRRPHKMRFDS